MQAREFLTSNQLISTNQYGFVKGWSCKTALINLSLLFLARDKGLNADIAALDFTKAFDIAHHDALLAKLSHLVFDSAACDCLNSYLLDRIQSIRYSGCTSQFRSACNVRIAGSQCDRTATFRHLHQRPSSIISSRQRNGICRRCETGSQRSD